MRGGLEPGTAGRHEVLRALTERAGTGESGAGRRVVLAIEGGGMRGTVSAGMAFALYELRLVEAFDAVYGSSAGAISGAWLLSSNPAGLHGWTEPAFARALISRYGPLRGRPVADVRALIEVVYQTTFPLDFGSVLSSPVEFHPLATDTATGHSADLRSLISDPAELRLALRASAAIPLLAGPHGDCPRRHAHTHPEVPPGPGGEPGAIAFGAPGRPHRLAAGKRRVPRDVPRPGRTAGRR
jgi:hypothetical protein